MENRKTATQSVKEKSDTSLQGAIDRMSLEQAFARLRRGQRTYHRSHPPAGGLGARNRRASAAAGRIRVGSAGPANGAQFDTNVSGLPDRLEDLEPAQRRSRLRVAHPRILFAITVYNGREVVFDCLQSAAAMAPKETTVDILVLDDASPDPGFSEEVEAACTDLGIGYYRSPRNLGIPRNVNLALLRALEAEYDYVVVANSDVLFCHELTDLMVTVAKTDSSIGSVTAWSNNVSIYSIPSTDPDRFLGNQETVNWVAQSLRGNYGSAAVDIPAGISFCILIPTPVLKEVGLMDPIFGRGYCEETDWSLRSKTLGYRVTLAPSCFVYHRGQVSNSAAGVLPTGHGTVPENEDIIDLRYPFFRQQVSAFVNSDILTSLHEDAVAKLIRNAVDEWGYVVEFGPASPAGLGHHPTCCRYRVT